MWEDDRCCVSSRRSQPFKDFMMFMMKLTFKHDKVCSECSGKGWHCKYDEALLEQAEAYGHAARSQGHSVP